MPLTDDALICAFDFDAGGRSAPISAREANEPPPEGGWRWVHCDRLHPAARDWLEQDADLPEPAVTALLDEETRPRAESFSGGIALILRGVNLNAGAEPDDMVAIRIWFAEDRIVTLRRYKVFAVQAVREAIEAGEPVPSPACFMAQLIAGLTKRLSDTIEELEDQVDALEQRSLGADPAPIRPRLTELRRDIIGYRRFLAPQKDAIMKLLSLSPPWLDDEARSEIGESLDDLNRVVELVDSVRDRAALLQEALANRAAEEMNRTMYVLSMIAAIFLPLGFVTGLLGINVGGMPGMDSSFGFAAVCLILIVILGLQIALFRKKGWF